MNAKASGIPPKFAATPENARLIAHRFADEIIFRLGGGIPGIAESRIYFISSRSSHKEVWVMDYDGQNQKQVTHLGSIALSPRVSPDGGRVAFTSFAGGGVELAMYSMDLGRMVAFPRYGGTNASAAWSPDGHSLVVSSSGRFYVPRHPEWTQQALWAIRNLGF